MPRTKLKPNSNDYKQILKFLKSVSWGSQCYLVYPLDGTRCCLVVPNKIESYIVVPCYWRDWESQGNAVLQVAELFHLKPGVLLYGDCPDYDCDRLNFELAKSGIVSLWNGSKNRLKQARFVLQATDGINIFNPSN